MEKFLLFSTGGDYVDTENLNYSEFAIYKSSNLVYMQPGSASTVELIFKVDGGGSDVVTLGILGGQHNKVLRSISQAIATTNNANMVISVADLDGYRFIDPNIWSVSIKHQYLDVLKTTTIRNLIIPTYSPCKIKSINLSNEHATLIAKTTMWITDKTGGDITSSAVLVNNGSGYSASINSTAVAVNTTDATNTIFENERIYKSDGTFVGVITAVGSTTSVTFGDGLRVDLADDDVLYVGTRYNILRSIEIPPGSTLALQSDDVNFDRTRYFLNISAFNGSTVTPLHIITRY
tara:strand:- start:514 stop:1389 length:876 start_codon:yes stop_codon:yes gene_type:complete